MLEEALSIGSSRITRADYFLPEMIHHLYSHGLVILFLCSLLTATVYKKFWKSNTKIRKLPKKENKSRCDVRMLVCWMGACMSVSCIAQPHQLPSEFTETRL